MIPEDVAQPLRERGLARAIVNLEAWIGEQRLEVVRAPTVAIPTYQVIIPVRPAHPLLTIQPPGYNPDVPLGKMRTMATSPYRNAVPRQGLVNALNAELPEPDRKDGKVRDSMFKLRWELFEENAMFVRLRGVLDEVIRTVRGDLG